jgi:hypothetical protein
MRNWVLLPSKKAFEIGIPVYSSLILRREVLKGCNSFYRSQKDLCMKKKMPKGMRSKGYHMSPLQKIRGVDGRMIVIARRAYDEKISNLTLHPSTALISPLMPS